MRWEKRRETGPPSIARNELHAQAQGRRTTGMCNCARVGSGRRCCPKPDCLPATAAAAASRPQQLHQQEPKQQAEHAEALSRAALSSSRPQAAKPSGKACALPVCEPVMLWGARRRPVAMMEAEQSCMWCGVEKKGRRTREIHSQQAKILYLGISKSDAPSR